MTELRESPSLNENDSYSGFIRFKASRDIGLHAIAPLLNDTAYHRRHQYEGGNFNFSVPSRIGVTNRKDFEAKSHDILEGSRQKWQRDTHRLPVREMQVYVNRHFDSEDASKELPPDFLISLRLRHNDEEDIIDLANEVGGEHFDPKAGVLQTIIPYGDLLDVRDVALQRDTFNRRIRNLGSRAALQYYVESRPNFTINR